MMMTSEDNSFIGAGWRLSSPLVQSGIGIKGTPGLCRSLMHARRIALILSAPVVAPTVAAMAASPDNRPVFRGMAQTGMKFELYLGYAVFPCAIGHQLKALSTAAPACLAGQPKEGAHFWMGTER
jgi:hypothetical protein